MNITMLPLTCLIMLIEASLVSVNIEQVVFLKSVGSGKQT